MSPYTGFPSTLTADASMSDWVYESEDGARFRAEPLDLRHPPHPELGQFLAYWEELRGGRVGPGEDELDPVAMRAYLSKVTLVRYDAASDSFTFGLSGTALYNLQKRDISYMAVREMRPPAYARMVEDQYREVVETAQPNGYRLSFEVPEGKSFYDTIRVPVSSDGVAVTGLATVDVFDERWWVVEQYVDNLRRMP